MNKILIGELGWQDDLEASMEASGQWTVQWSYVSKDIKFNNIPKKCPYPLFNAVPFNNVETSNIGMGYYLHKVTYKQGEFGVMPYTKVVGESDKNESIEQNQGEENFEFPTVDPQSTFQYSRNCSTTQLIDHSMFNSLKDDSEQKEAIEYVTSCRCKLDDLNTKLRRLDEEDTTFNPNLILNETSKKYLDFWQRGIEQYMVPVSNYTLTGNQDLKTKNKVLSNLYNKYNGKWNTTSISTNLDANRVSTTTISETTYEEEGMLKWQ